MREIFIGDVHGCSQELKLLLEKTDYRQDIDKLYFVGDLINKGPDSLEVLRIAEKCKAKIVLGNHEFELLQSLDKHAKGGKNLPSRTKKFIATMGDEISFWHKYILKWPLFIQEKHFLLVHAGIAPGIAVEKTPGHILTEIRAWDKSGKKIANPDKFPPWYHYYREKKLIIYGHWAKAGLVIRKNTIGLDSGCVYGKQLSALDLQNKKIYQVTAKECYQPITNTPSEAC